MAEISIGDALKNLFKDQHWDNKLYDKKIRSDWEIIVGKTISNYTDNLHLSKNVLVITTSVAVLKHELQLMKPQLIERINEHLKNNVVKDIVIK